MLNNNMPNLRQSFAGVWLKINENCKHGNILRFLDAGTNEGNEEQAKWVFLVGIVENGQVGSQKKFTLNKTNYNETAKVFGDNTDNWINKEMQINAVKVRNPKTNSYVDGIMLTAPFSNIQ